MADIFPSNPNYTPSHILPPPFLFVIEDSQYEVYIIKDVLNDSYSHVISHQLFLISLLPEIVRIHCFR